MMGNYYETLSRMEEGDIATSGFSTDIVKDAGSFYYAEKGTGEKLYGWGRSGHIIFHEQMEDENWKIKETEPEPTYISIGLEEVADRLRDNKPVYMDRQKKLIEKLDTIDEFGMQDFEDVLLLSNYYKMA